MIGSSSSSSLSFSHKLCFCLAWNNSLRDFSSSTLLNWDFNRVRFDCKTSICLCRRSASCSVLGQYLYQNKSYVDKKNDGISGTYIVPRLNAYFKFTFNCSNWVVNCVNLNRMPVEILEYSLDNCGCWLRSTIFDWMSELKRSQASNSVSLKWIYQNF